MFKSRHPMNTPFVLSRSLTTTACLVLGLAMLPAHAQVTGETNARNLLKENRVEEALAAIETELKGRPHEGPLWLLKGTALSMSDRKDEAVRLFRKMIQDRMEVASAYNNLAVIYTERGDFESAKIALESAIRSKPEYAVALRNLGNVYANLAGMSYKRALQLDESDQTLSARLTHLGDMLGKKFDQRLGPPQFANPAESPAESGKSPTRRFDPSAPQVASAAVVATPATTEPVIIPSRSQVTSRSENSASTQFASASASAEPVIISAKAPAPTIISGQNVIQQQAVAYPATARYVQNTNVHYGSAESAQTTRLPNQPTIQATVQPANQPNTPVTLQWKQTPTIAPPAVRTAYYVSSPMTAAKAPAPVTLVSAVTAATLGVYCDGVRVAGEKCPR